MSLSVVIPALDEAGSLPALLTDLHALGDALDEIIVSDGGSSDSTCAVARAGGARVVTGPRGRARQLNAGARAAQGEWLLFLHADSRLDTEARVALLQVLPDPRVAAAVFRFRIDLPLFAKRFIEWGQQVRERVSGLAYGDQGLLVRRDRFMAVGGYPDLPLMEDVVLVQRLKRRHRVARLPAGLTTSGRRYREHGVLRTWLAHTLLIALFAAGYSPARLARWRSGLVSHVR
jgi:rSAM/selenodomain-associated transferase 2